MTISVIACPSCGAGLDASRLTAHPTCPYCNTPLHLDRSGEQLTLTAQAMQSTAADLARLAQQTATQNARLQATWRYERIHDQLAELDGTKQRNEINRLKEQEHALIEEWPDLEPMPVTVLTPGRSVALGLLVIGVGIIVDQVVAPVPVILTMLLALTVMALTRHQTIT